MFGHPAPARSDDETGGRGNIEQVGAVAAGADDVHQVFAPESDATGQFPHHHHRTGNFIQGFTLQPQPHQECPDLGVGRLSVHDLAHHGLHLFQRQITSVGTAVQVPV